MDNNNDDNRADEQKSLSFLYSVVYTLLIILLSPVYGYSISLLNPGNHENCPTAYTFVVTNTVLLTLYLLVSLVNCIWLCRWTRDNLDQPTPVPIKTIFCTGEIVISAVTLFMYSYFDPPTCSAYTQNDSFGIVSWSILLAVMHFTTFGFLLLAIVVSFCSFVRSIPTVPAAPVAPVNEIEVHIPSITRKNSIVL